MNAPVTRRALLGATAAVGAMALPAIAEAGIPVPLPADPNAVLLDLIRRHDEADQALRLAEDEAEQLLGIAREAYPERPAVLYMRQDDFPRTGMRFSASRPREDDGVRVYDERASVMLRDRPAAMWFRTPSPPLGPESEARRLEILEAFDAWTAEKAAVDAFVGYTAADEARAVAGQAFWSLDDEIREYEVRTLPALRIKAEWLAKRSDNGLDETKGLLAFAREMAAFGRATS